MRILDCRTTMTLVHALSISSFAALAACSDGSGREPAPDEIPGLGQLDRTAIDESLPGARRVTDLSIEQAAAGKYHVRFHSLGRDFSLRLAPNYELFAPDAVVERDGVEMTLREAGLEPPLRGSVEGDPKSWVRVRLQGGTVDGLIFTQGALFEVRRSAIDVGELAMSRSSIGDYLENPTGNEATCGVVDSAPPADEGEAQPFVPHHACIWIGIHIISDYTHVAKLGGTTQAEADMATRMNEIDAIYRTDLEYGFRVEKVTSHSTQGGPGYNAPNLSINAQLTALTSWKQQNDAARGIVHLFAGRVTSGAVGLAWVGSLCTPGNASGVSNYLGANRGSTIDACHEIGHNFGADHDPGNGYIMQASVNSKAEHFSPMSLSQIRAHVGKASTMKCFSPCGVDPGTGGAGGMGGAGGAGGAGGRGAGGGGTAGSGGSAGRGGAAGSAGAGGSAGRGGAAGSTGMGGAAGSIGVGGAAGSIGAGGSGGAAGNSSGSGGSAGSGNTGSTTTTGSAGSTTGGGGSQGAGGAAGTGVGAGGTQSTPPRRAATSDDGGCSCRSVAPSRSSNGFAAFFLALAGAAVRRRPRRRQAKPCPH
jgi:MYXO-CTERM domain-containing protein